MPPPVSYPLFTASKRFLQEVNGHGEKARHPRDSCCLLPLARRVGRVLRRRGRLAEQSLATRSLQPSVFRHCNPGILNTCDCSLAKGTQVSAHPIRKFIRSFEWAQLDAVCCKQAHTPYFSAFSVYDTVCLGVENSSSCRNPQAQPVSCLTDAALQRNCPALPA